MIFKIIFIVRMRVRIRVKVIVRARFSMSHCSGQVGARDSVRVSVKIKFSVNVK